MQRSELSPTFNPEPSVANSIIDHMIPVYGLGVVAFFAHKMQVDNTMVEWPENIRDAMNSMSHPFLGYTGATIANALHRTKNYVTRIYYGYGLGTLTNFGTEIAQSVLVPHSPETNFLAYRNIPETTKDYVFALGGIGLFAFREKRLQKKRI